MLQPPVVAREDLSEFSETPEIDKHLKGAAWMPESLPTHQAYGWNTRDCGKWRRNIFVIRA
jgi:hypothetical protein